MSITGLNKSIPQRRKVYAGARGVKTFLSSTISRIILLFTVSFFRELLVIGSTFQKCHQQYLSIVSAKKQTQWIVNKNLIHLHKILMRKNQQVRDDFKIVIKNKIKSRQLKISQKNVRTFYCNEVIFLAFNSKEANSAQKCASVTFSDMCWPK